MSDLRNKLRDWRDGMAKLGFPAHNVNWQSIAVLLHNLPQHDGRIKGNLLSDRGGWATLGWHEDRDDGTSLYLSPKGMVYWLHHGGHFELYHRLFEVNQEQMDRAGWLHISGCRVDIKAAPTRIQRSWLDGFTPQNARGEPATWREAPYPTHSGMTASPVPYDKVSRFDVRPVPDFDLDNDEHWDRLMLRILRAADPNVPA